MENIYQWESPNCIPNHKLHLNVGIKRIPWPPHCPCRWGACWWGWRWWCWRPPWGCRWTWRSDLENSSPSRLKKLESLFCSSLFFSILYGQIEQETSKIVLKFLLFVAPLFLLLCEWCEIFHASMHKNMLFLHVFIFMCSGNNYMRNCKSFCKSKSSELKTSYKI